MQEYYQRAALEHLLLRLSRISLSLEYITKSNSNNFLYKDKKQLLNIYIDLRYISRASIVYLNRIKRVYKKSKARISPL